MTTIYIGQKLTLLCFSCLRFENQNQKQTNDVYHHAPLNRGKEVQRSKSWEI
nr:MAG TPA: hypothetical protein [Caudoviricetes sp.]